VSALAVEVLARGAAADAELSAFFAACPTSVAQQTPGWRDAIASLGQDEALPLAARRDGRLVGVLPAWRYAGPLGAILTSAAQAGPLGGVACLPEVDPGPVYAALLGAFRELAAERGCALASVLTNPFWPDADLCERCFGPGFVLENTCQVLVLDASSGGAGGTGRARENLRRNLRRARSGRLVVDEAQTAANVAEWYALHAARQRQIGATPLPERLFAAALEHAVPRDKARFFFVRLADGGDLVAGGLYLYHGRVMDALMPSASSEYSALAPGYLLADHSIGFARARGLRFYNWQASPPGGGVRRFKLQWGSRELRYRYLTRVTGDARAFLAGPVEAVRRGYPWHYALPFDRIGAGAAAGVVPSSRESAWQAGEAERG